MPANDGDNTPYWETSATFPRFARLSQGVEADVVVVGGGVTGLTSAYLLAKAGKAVVVLERDRCAMTDTGHTSAHLTMVTDSRMTELAKRFGRNHAQAVWDAGLAAIAFGALLYAFRIRDWRSLFREGEAARAEASAK